MTVIDIADAPEVSTAELTKLAWSTSLEWLQDPPDPSAFRVAERYVRKMVARWERRMRNREKAGLPPLSWITKDDIRDLRAFLKDAKAKHLPASAGNASE